MQNIPQNTDPTWVVYFYLNAGVTATFKSEEKTKFMKISCKYFLDFFKIFFVGISIRYIVFALFRLRTCS